MGRFSSGKSPGKQPIKKRPVERFLRTRKFFLPSPSSRDQRTPWGGGKKRGEKNLTNDTPPKKGFWTPLVRYVFHPPQVSVLCFPVQKSTTDQTRSSFGGVQKFSGERVLWYVFLPPYVLHPPISPPKGRELSEFSSSAWRGAPDGVATLKVRKDAVDVLIKGSGALGRVNEVVAPSGAPPEELYEVPLSLLFVCQKRTHRFLFPELTEFALKNVRLSEFSPPKQYSRNEGRQNSGQGQLREILDRVSATVDWNRRPPQKGSMRGGRTDPVQSKRMFWKGIFKL